MKRVSTYSLALPLAISGAGFGFATPVAAQGYGGSEPPPTGQQFENQNDENRNRDSEREEQQAGSFDASQLSNAVREQAGAAQQILGGEAPDLAAVEQALTAAEAAIANNHDRFFVGSLLLQLSVQKQQGGATNEQIIPIQRRGLQLAVDSGLLAADQHARYLRFLGGMAENPEQALAAFRAAAEANPNDAEVHIQLARALFNAGETAAGYDAAERAIQLADQNGVAFD
ncbi:MAG: hypothetical protein LC634_08145 [Sphingomonadales bacterium]|nr:hypothetical protein [Sphingomonadales bacterium]